MSLSTYFWNHKLCIYNFPCWIPRKQDYIFSNQAPFIYFFSQAPFIYFFSQYIWCIKENICFWLLGNTSHSHILPAIYTKKKKIVNTTLCKMKSNNRINGHLRQLKLKEVLKYTRTQYPRYTRTYKKYIRIFGSRNTRTYKSKRIHFEHICCLEKIFCFCFVLKKIFWLSDCEKKISGFLSEENKNKILGKKPSPPPLPENQMVSP